MPAEDAIRYFMPEDMTDPLPFTDKQYVARWLKAKTVKAALLKLQGKPWTEMTLDEQLNYAIDKVYREMAYFLYATNYSTLSGADRAKADTCRAAIEAKLSGMAGKMDAMSKFLEDFSKGKFNFTPVPIEKVGQLGN